MWVRRWALRWDDLVYTFLHPAYWHLWIRRREISISSPDEPEEEEDDDDEEEEEEEDESVDDMLFDFGVFGDETEIMLIVATFEGDDEVDNNGGEEPLLLAGDEVNEGDGGGEDDEEEDLPLILWIEMETAGLTTGFKEEEDVDCDNFLIVVVVGETDEGEHDVKDVLWSWFKLRHDMLEEDE